jgi:hypothetical protein
MANKNAGGKAVHATVLFDAKISQADFHKLSKKVEADPASAPPSPPPEAPQRKPRSEAQT